MDVTLDFDCYIKKYLSKHFHFMIFVIFTNWDRGKCSVLILRRPCLRPLLYLLMLVLIQISKPLGTFSFYIDKDKSYFFGNTLIVLFEMTTCLLVSLISSQDLVFTKNMKNLNASPGNFRKVPTIQGSDKVFIYKSRGGLFLLMQRTFRCVFKPIFDLKYTLKKKYSFITLS